VEEDYQNLCNLMVSEQLKPRNIKSEAVLQAMRSVPRHLFVPDHLQKHVYDDSPLPIGLGQTISQPYIVAYMSEYLEPCRGTKILEIGTGSGYQTAILSCLGCEVYTIELLEELAVKAERIFQKLKFDKKLNLSNIKIKCANGYSGWQEEAPFDAIIITAAPEKIPEKLVEQLAEGGKMILPVGPVNSVQFLKLVTKKDNKIIEKDLLPVRFVPMVE
jgi:protein-L-isoaspartate(D-aspartate) O-methyltransferase